MTVQASLRKAGPYLGDAVTTAFFFSFKVFASTDLVVTYLNSYGVESTLNLVSDYTVTLNFDQDNTPGGTVNLNWAPALNTRITLSTQLDYTQTLALTNAGGFYPSSINTALDRIVIQIQQIFEKIQRAIVLPLTSTGSAQIGNPSAGQTVAFDASGNITLVNASTGTSLVNLAAGTGSALVGYSEGDSGAQARTVQNKLKERISVTDFGADPTGVIDATSAFSLCAKSGSAINNLDNNITSIPVTPVCVRYLPAGIYKLLSLVDTGNRQVIWIALGELRVQDASGNSAVQYLNGKLVKEGQMMGNDHFGIRDTATTFSVVANRPDYMRDAQVDGYGSLAALNTYYSRDSVCLYAYNESPAALVATTTATYTNTTVTLPALEIPSADTVKKYRVGMAIDTKHSPKYSGILKSWNANGSVLTVDGWYQLNGSGASLPPNTAGIYVNPITKVWGQNTVVKISADVGDTHYAKQAAGYELNLINYNSPASGTAYDVWGFDVSNKDGYVCDNAFNARKNWYYAFNFQDADGNNLCGAGNFVIGNKYIIQAIGNVSFTTIGAATGVVGEQFTASGTGGNNAFTVTIANPSGLLTAPSTVTFANNQIVTLATTGALPTGLTAGTTYYVVNASTNTCKLATTPGGTAITVSSAGSGTHTVTITGAGVGTARQVFAPSELQKYSQYVIATTGASGFTGIGASSNAQGTIFIYNGNSVTGVTGNCYLSSQVASSFYAQADGNLLTGKDSLGNTFYTVTSSGNALMGSQNIPSPTYFDLHSAGSSTWDARIIGNNGVPGINSMGLLSFYADNFVLANAATGTAVNATSIKLQAGTVQCGGNLVPLVDNSVSLGAGSLRWSVVYAATSAINTSDARQKQAIAELTDAEKRVAMRLKNLIRTFKFNQDVLAKGNLARIHVGVIAQDVEAAFAAEGLNGFNYGLLCYDEWPATDDLPAGNAYGIRYEELLAFVLAAL